MASHKKRPSGDVVHDDEAVVLTAIEPEAPPIVVPEAAPIVEGVSVDLLDVNGIVTDRVTVADRSFLLTHGGKVWRHVSEHADGTWQYAE
jgi:hypothetical protein